MNKGIIYGVAAYGLWGVLPIYWKALSSVPALEVMAHRVVWALLFSFLVVLARDRKWLLSVMRRPGAWVTFIGTGALLAINWYVFIWAIGSGFTIQTSLGYFINPLVNVLFGVLILKETMRKRQLVAVAMAAAGVLWLTLSAGKMPWIALTLATTFGLYGLLRKTAPLEALKGHFLEIAFVAIPMLPYLLLRHASGNGAFLADARITLLLMAAGPITSIPLILFSAGARLTRLSTMGLLQYLSPTCQFLIGVYVFREPFSGAQLVGFVLVWSALFVYTADALGERRKASYGVAD